MSQPTAPASNDEASTCFLCGRKIIDGQWFARIPHQSRLVLFCRPLCVEAFLHQQECAAANQTKTFRPFEN